MSEYPALREQDMVQALEFAAAALNDELITLTAS